MFRKKGEQINQLSHLFLGLLRLIWSNNTRVPLVPKHYHELQLIFTNIADVSV